jgi:hypothetical protein
MLIRFFLVFLFTTSAWACWRIEGKLAIDGQSWAFDQKVNHDKTYSLPAGNFIFSFNLIKKAEDILFSFSVFEKKSNNLILVSKGEENLRLDHTKDIFAKGESNQPNAIVTIKIKKN